jgi:azurin
LNAPADTLVTLTFNNINDLGVQHNWVLVDGGADVATAVNTAASGNAAELFTPPAGTADGLAWTAMVNAGDSGSVTFRTPAAPGTYLFICTFPGHYAAGMIGDFVVE